MPYHYTTRGKAVWRAIGSDTGDCLTDAPAAMARFEFLRYRFRFTALDPVWFPAGKMGNVIRGAFGLALRDTAPPETYERLFEPKSTGAGPSGLADPPRPFVFRMQPIAALDPGQMMHLDVHLFDRSSGLCDHFRNGFAEWQRTGLGPRRGRVRLDDVELLPPSEVELDPDPVPVERVTVEFVTPTELKSDGKVIARPEFPILFARLRDRICTLSALYGAGPLEIDFRAMGERAREVRLTHLEIVWEDAERTSSRTGQTHSIGGFSGRAEYEGALAEFLPWLRAGQWTGVGRQTVWGKGDIRVVTPGKP